MSPKTKTRRRRRKAIAAIVSILRDEPRRTDPVFARITPSYVREMCFYAAHMRWEYVHVMAMHSRRYDAAKRSLSAEL